jgi:hypothetical protein
VVFGLGAPGLQKTTRPKQTLRDPFEVFRDGTLGVSGRSQPLKVAVPSSRTLRCACECRAPPLFAMPSDKKKETPHQDACATPTGPLDPWMSPNPLKNYRFLFGPRMSPNPMNVQGSFCQQKRATETQTLK